MANFSKQIWDFGLKVFTKKPSKNPKKYYLSQFGIEGRGRSPELGKRHIYVILITQ